MWAKIKAWFYKLIGRKPKVDEVFGLEVFDENGNLDFSANEKTFGVVLRFNVTGNTDVPFVSNTPLGFLVIYSQETAANSLITGTYSGGVIRIRYIVRRVQNGNSINVPAQVLVYHV